MSGPATAAATGARGRLRRRLAGGAPSRAVVAKRRVRYSLVVLLLLLLAVLTTGIFATINLYRSAEDRYIGLVLPLRTTTRDVVYQMQREETGVRGYMITTNRRSLAPYFAGRKGVVADLARITSLTHGRPALAARLRDVRREVLALHGFYDRLIVFVADGDVGQQRARREVLDGESLAARFRHTAALMQDDIGQFVQETQAEQRHTYDRTLAALIVSGALAFAVAASLLLKVPERLRQLYAAEEDARLRAEQGANAARALAHVSDAVLLVDDDGAIRFWNEAAEQLFGRPAAVTVGRNAAVAVPGYETLVAAARAHEQFVPVQIGDDERWLAPALSAFDGGSVLALRDATAGYVLERTRTDFVATASHELRTPITAVFGGARTLIAHGDSLDPRQRLRLLQVIEQESEHLVQIVDQLLISAQLDRGTLHVDEIDCDLPLLCSGVVESARVRAANGVAVALETPTSLALRCDESLLRQVLVNLVENAVKYSAEGDHVNVRLSEDAGRVHIEVQDEGLGIPPSEQERIFEKFYRLDAAMTRGVGGSGLGLYISREIVTQLGGTLSVRSAPGQGSTFTVTLPRPAVAA